MPDTAAPNVTRAEYLVEARGLNSLPAEGGPEIAIAGRSNVGKSTLLNRLSRRNALARTSKTPGRTRGLIFYELELRMADQARSLRLVDLPGYGFAKVPTTERQGWGQLVEGYVKNRRTLSVVLSLVDARRGIDAEELELYEWLESEGVPYQVVLTKTDKLSAGERGLLKDRTKQALRPYTPKILLVSGQTGDGVDRLWQSILQAMDEKAGEVTTP